MDFSILIVFFRCINRCYEHTAYRFSEIAALPHSPKLAQLVSGTPRGAAVKSSQCSDEIVRFAHDEIKSVLQPDEVGFHRAAISSTLAWI